MKSWIAMRRAVFGALALVAASLLVAFAPHSRALAVEKPDAKVLVGAWKVDLRPKPGAAEYFQEFVVTKVNADNSFEGTFYGSNITNGRVNTEWGAVRIAFVTADQSGPYNHSAVLRDGKLEGLTNSIGRGFLSYWSALRQ